MLSSKLNLNMYIKILIIFCLLIFNSCNIIDNLNPDVVAKIDDTKISLKEIKKEIKQENPDIKITKPLIVFYIKEKIKEKILEDEFKKLGFKITKQDIEKYPDLQKLNPQNLRKIIIFDKVKKYVVRKLTFPSDKECLEYYKKHIKEFDHIEKVRIKYIVFDDKKECEKFYNQLIKNKNFDKLLKEWKLNYTYKGIIKVKNIPEEIKSQIDYTKPNSFWIAKVSDRCYVINCIEYLKNKPIPFKEVKMLIKKKLLSQKQSELFDLWLKKQMQLHKIKIYYDKIK